MKEKTLADFLRILRRKAPSWIYFKELEEEGFSQGKLLEMHQFNRGVFPTTPLFENESTLKFKILEKGLDYLRQLEAHESQKNLVQGSKVMSIATVAIALSAAINAIAAFNQFNVERTWDLAALIIMALLVIVVVSLSIYSLVYLFSKKN